MTATRVLPWRRDAAPIDQLVPLLELFLQRWPEHDTELIRRAYATAAAAHGDQRRKSGEAYIFHPLSVAMVVAELGLDEVTIAAALLHDAVEDTGLSLPDVAAAFGEEVAHLVDGVTKLDQITFDTKEAAQAATMRKMLVAMARDLRVLIIKLADRLHNISTIAALSPEKQARKARETLDIYAPLAHRLGMEGMRQRLEDLAFAALYPKRYAEVDQLVATATPAQDQYIDDVVTEVQRQLSVMGIEAEVIGRSKHLWSIYEKMVVKGRGFDEIFDLVAIRVVVDSIRDCYAVLGLVHGTWHPVQGRFKDYIAMPKFNLYQSLHTTVVGPGGTALEVQIRTSEQHHRAEFGVAAHWRYKGESGEAEVPWLDRLVDWEKETSDPDEFMESLRGDLEHDEVYVFTPKGDVVTMPIGATSIDFAYAIHTDIGQATIGVKLNGRLVPLNRELESGDSVEIFTSKLKTAGPSLDWLQMAVTPRARNKIRQWFAKERRDDAIESGRDELEDAVRRAGLPVKGSLNGEAMVSLIETLGYGDLEAMLLAIGENHLSPRSVAQRLDRELRGGTKEEQLPVPAIQNRTSRKRRDVGVHVEGLDDVMVRVARCCNPVPGDEIMGFVTRGRGVSVHRSDCANAVGLADAQGGRLVDVEWDDAFDGSFIMSIEVRALDRSRLLEDVSRALSDHHVNIRGCTTTTGSDHVTAMTFEFELVDPSHLDTLLRSVRSIPSVFEAVRALPGAPVLSA
ncbi:MAG: bifunctional (p)ppGpp synthetase/guanosine-3',5'-bis(diphosphate) 3'-pyrophosphohydrolase [Actinobacteria bacterium]|nr:bifunctional (p)ppGpp synthetase/guanosine-3',5'-bis(diphosphate) 3'-pyrophosphohydrolase [Actinomycetota bacterium]